MLNFSRCDRTTRRTFKEAIEDNEITFFIIRGICSKLTLMLSSFLFIIILRKYFKKKKSIGYVLPKTDQKE